MNTKNKKHKTILVVEDERSLLEVVKAKLEKSGFKVITSRSVERAFAPPLLENAAGTITLGSVEMALKHLEELEHVDAIWLDHNLLGKDNGLDFVEKLKANGGKWTKIPIFVVSNTSDSDLVKKYQKAGVKNYYVKAEHTLESIIAHIQK